MKRVNGRLKTSKKSVDLRKALELLGFLIRIIGLFMLINCNLINSY